MTPDDDPNCVLRGSPLHTYRYVPNCRVQSPAGAGWQRVFHSPTNKVWVRFAGMLAHMNTVGRHAQQIAVDAIDAGVRRGQSTKV